MATRAIESHRIVTPHFTVEEFRCHDGTPYPSRWVLARLAKLCAALEVLRHHAGDVPLAIISGFRTEAYNRAIRGARLSQHVQGRAADVRPVGITSAELHAVALDLFRRGLLDIGGLGLYPSWVHVDVRPRPPGGPLAQWSGAGVGSEVA